MKLTANELRQIIREEVIRVTEAAASPGKLVAALNVAQLVSEIDNEYAPVFDVDNTDKRSFRPGDVIVDCSLEDDGSRFVVTVVEDGLQVVSQSAGSRPRKVVINDASPAAAEKLSALAHDAFGSATGISVFEDIMGGEIVKRFGRYGINVTVDNSKKSSMKNGDVIVRMEQDGRGKKKFLELVNHTSGLGVRTSDPKQSIRYPGNAYGVEEDLHMFIANFFGV